MSIEGHELLQGTLYNMFWASMARRQIERYCWRSGEDVNNVSAKLMANLLDQHPMRLNIQADATVDSLFIWGDSPEGRDYWEKVDGY